MATKCITVDLQQTQNVDLFIISLYFAFKISNTTGSKRTENSNINTITNEYIEPANRIIGKVIEKVTF